MHAVAHHAAVEDQVGRRHQPVADVEGGDAAAGARPCRAPGPGPTRHDRHRARRRGPAPSSSQRSSAWPSVFTHARSARIHRVQRLDREGHAGARGPRAGWPAARRAPSPARRRGPCEPGGRPPTTITRQSAPERMGFVDGAAVVLDRRAAARRVGRREHAAAAEAGDLQRRRRGRCAPLRPARAPHLVAPGRDAAGCRGAAQPSMLSREVQRSAPSPCSARAGPGGAHHATPLHRQQRAHPRAARSGSRSSPAASASRNSSARCMDAARALLSADHGEMRLVAVQPGHEHHAGLVEARRRLEDMPAQRHRRRQDGVEAAQVAARQRGQRRRPPPARWDRRCRAARRSSPAASPAISSGVVEVVAGVHAHARRQPAAHGDLLLLVEQRDLDAVHLGGIVADDGRAPSPSPRQWSASPQ